MTRNIGANGRRRVAVSNLPHPESDDNEHADQPVPKER
jgi:hypothetical protein